MPCDLVQKLCSLKLAVNLAPNGELSSATVGSNGAIFTSGCYLKLPLLKTPSRWANFTFRLFTLASLRHTPHTTPTHSTFTTLLYNLASCVFPLHTLRYLAALLYVRLLVGPSRMCAASVTVRGQGEGSPRALPLPTCAPQTLSGAASCVSGCRRRRLG